MIRVICAFPGTGKSYFHKLYPDITFDSDSSNFSWESPGVRHRNWPYNYIEHIEEVLENNKDKIIFVSTHKDLLQALKEKEIPFVVISPDHYCKEEYINRFRERGNDEKFIDTLAKNFNSFLADLSEAQFKISLTKKEYISDVIKVLPEGIFIKATCC